MFHEAETATSGGGEQGDTTLIAEQPAGGEQQQQQSSGYFNPEGTFADGWIDRLPADFIPEAERDAFKVHAAKYKNPLEVIKANFHKEKIIGKKGVPIPTETSTPEEIAAYRKAVGAPESPDQYQLKPEKLPEGVDWNDDLAKPFAEIAHKYHIPQKAMQELVAAQLATEQSRGAVLAQSIEQELSKGREELKKTFGGEYENKINTVKRVAATVGVDPLSRGFTDPEMVKAFARLGEMLSEDKLTGGGGGGGGQSGAAKAKDIQTNPQNPLYQKYQEGDPDTVALVRSYRQQG